MTFLTGRLGSPVRGRRQDPPPGAAGGTPLPVSIRESMPTETRPCSATLLQRHQRSKPAPRRNVSARVAGASAASIISPPGAEDASLQPLEPSSAASLGAEDSASPPGQP